LLSFMLLVERGQMHIPAIGSAPTTRKQPPTNFTPTNDAYCPLKFK
jgi:hypothetical protein